MDVGKNNSGYSLALSMSLFLCLLSAHDAYKPPLYLTLVFITYLATLFTCLCMHLCLVPSGLQSLQMEQQCLSRPRLVSVEKECLGPC